MVSGYFGATTPAIHELFRTRFGWIAIMLLLNVIPWVAIAVKDNPVLGVTALVVDGLVAGIALSPILYFASVVNPTLILAALMVTGAVFLAVSGYVMTSGRTFSAPRGLMIGLLVSITVGIVLNMFLNIGVLGLLISVAIGAFGVFSLVYSTSTVLNSPDSTSPIPGALMLFSGLFNVFNSVLNILLRLFGGGGGRRD